MKRLLLLLPFVISGCTETVRMHHPDGRLATCGSYPIGVMVQGAQRERACIDDYARQGFLRMP